MAIGMRIKDGSYGGGNQFAACLDDFLISHGIEVVYELDRQDIDMILLADPRVQSASAAFGPLEIIRYIRSINNNALVVHRINECDERKGTKSVNRQIINANAFCDYTVYIGTWLIDLFLSCGLKTSGRHCVIKNGGDRDIFIFQKKALPREGKIKIVTHHWSNNLMKGWDVYRKLDRMLNDENFSSRFEFHYIGNAPGIVKTRNVIYHSACSGKRLAAELGDKHIYLTASINEPAGMHHVEGALCGLPLLYRESGALPEYCRGFGVSFNGPDDFAPALEKIIASYETHASRMADYPNTAEKMCLQYLDLFKNLYDNKVNIIRERGVRKFSFWKYAKYKLSRWYYKFMIIMGIEERRQKNKERSILTGSVYV